MIAPLLNYDFLFIYLFLNSPSLRLLGLEDNGFFTQGEVSLDNFFPPLIELNYHLKNCILYSAG